MKNNNPSIAANPQDVDLTPDERNDIRMTLGGKSMPIQ
jgi:hypothetical protein